MKPVSGEKLGFVAAVRVRWREQILKDLFPLDASLVGMEQFHAKSPSAWRAVYRIPSDVAILNNWNEGQVGLVRLKEVFGCSTFEVRSWRAVCLVFLFVSFVWLVWSIGLTAK